MNKNTYESFCKIKEAYKKFVRETAASFPRLSDLQQELANSRAGRPYIVETPVVYNNALDAVTVNDEIKIILVADNPGKKEQEASVRSYLTGASGKLAERFFKMNGALGVDFRKNVIILNKTPIHTPRTNELKTLCKNSGSAHLKNIIDESQRFCAQTAFDFWRIFKNENREAQVWITGYCEMKKNGVFEAYRQKLLDISQKNGLFYDSIFIFRHFSMNQFTIDLNKKRPQFKDVKETLEQTGIEYRKKVLPLQRLCG
ncbi:MAG: hypothetical protein LBC53_04975 [Spirochaetaceae bacterium]|jgi:hypothetical protein|nr:hypothetical protein [Spirochaetaceae bacterium]